MAESINVGCFCTRCAIDPDIAVSKIVSEKNDNIGGVDCYCRRLKNEQQCGNSDSHISCRGIYEPIRYSHDMSAVVDWRYKSNLFLCSSKLVRRGCACFGISPFEFIEILNCIYERIYIFFSAGATTSFFLAMLHTFVDFTVYKTHLFKRFILFAFFVSSNCISQQLVY
jgi:hypothetical protein